MTVPSAEMMEENIEFNARMDLGTLQEAELIKGNTKRMDGIRKLVAKQVRLMEKLVLDQAALQQPSKIKVKTQKFDV